MRKMGQCISVVVSCNTGRTVDIGQGLGWGMTVTYLGARVPQLVKNFRRGTAEGLSPFMFVLLVLGSITYALSIFIRYEGRVLLVFGSTMHALSIFFMYSLITACCCLCCSEHCCKIASSSAAAAAAAAVPIVYMLPAFCID